MRHEFKLIDVTEAAALLKRNTRNRNLNAKVVATLTRALANGEWAVNGEAIKISEEGDVLDGQHRLAAIVQSGIPMETLVISGLPVATQDTMDAGRRRTTADVMKINGEDNANVLASVAKRAWQWNQGNTRFTTTSLPTTAEVRATLDKHPVLRRSAEMGVRVNRGYRPANATVTGTAHFLFSDVDQDTTAKFFARLASGAELGEDDPILTLRTRLLRDQVTSKAIPFHQNVAYYIRAWNAVREGRTLAVIIQTAADPLPGIV